MNARRWVLVNRLAWPVWMALALAAQGCSSDTAFKGQDSKKSNDAVPAGPGFGNPDDEDEAAVDDAQSNADTSNDTAEAGSLNLTWYLPCADEAATPPAAKGNEKVLTGSGPFNFTAKELANAKLTFAGHLCTPVPGPRDVVLVIDTSGSMKQNDRGNKDSCARLDAVKAVIASIPAGTGQFALVTFSSDVDKSSTLMFGTEAEP